MNATQRYGMQFAGFVVVTAVGKKKGFSFPRALLLGIVGTGGRNLKIRPGAKFLVGCRWSQGEDLARSRYRNVNCAPGFSRVT